MIVLRLLFGVLVGGVLGYGVYHFIVCASGACPLAVDPWVSTIVGMVFGPLLAKRPPLGLMDQEFYSAQHA